MTAGEVFAKILDETWTYLKGLLASRGFWTGIGPGIISFFALIGHPIAEGKQQALLAICSMVVGWLGITGARVLKGEPGSYRKLLRGD